MTPAQCRASRALLGIGQEALAHEAGVSRPVVFRFETGKADPMPQNLAAIQRALEKRGIEFIGPDSDGVGVRLRQLHGS